MDGSTDAQQSHSALASAPMKDGPLSAHAGAAVKAAANHSNGAPPSHPPRSHVAAHGGAHPPSAATKDAPQSMQVEETPAAPTKPPRSALSFSLHSTQRRKRGTDQRVDADRDADLLRAVKLAKVELASAPSRASVPPSSTGYRPPPPFIQRAHGQERERMKAQLLKERAASGSTSSSSSPSVPASENSARAHRLLTAGDVSVPLTTTELVLYISENERARMHTRYQLLFAKRQKEKEQQQAYKEKGKTPPPPPSSSSGLLLRLADEALQVNVSNHFSLGKDASGRVEYTPTRFKGGSAIDALMAKDAQAVAAGSLPSTHTALQSSLTVSMFQHGFSINSDDSNWHDYTPANLVMLQHMDAGYLPPLFSSLNPQLQPPLTFYDGHVLVDVKDYRAVQMQTGIREPKTRKLLLRPTQESVQMDVRAVVQEAGIDSPLVEALVEGEVLKHIRPRVCLWPSPRVFQVLNLVHFNRAKGAAIRPSRVELEQRSLELFDAMGEAIFGQEPPDLDVEGDGRGEGEQQLADVQLKEEERKEDEPGPATRALERFPALPKAVRERLLRRKTKEEEARERAKKDRELRAQMKKEESAENEDEQADPVVLSRAIQREKPAGARSPPTLTSAAAAASSRFLPLLAYSSFAYHTSAARQLAAGNALLLDPLTRRTWLSGPSTQTARANHAYAMALEQYKKEQAAGGNPTAAPPVLNRPQTITGKIDTLPLHDRKLPNPNDIPVGDWSTWAFQQPVPGNPRASVHVELFVHSVPCPSTSLQLPPMASGRFEVFARWTNVGAGEAQGTPSLVLVGSREEVRNFVREFGRCVLREGGSQLTKAPQVQFSTPLRLGSDVLKEMEEKADKLQRMDEQNKAAQQRAPAAPQPQPPQPNTANPTVPAVNGPQSRRPTAGKQPMQPGHGPASSLGLPAAMYPTAGNKQPRREDGHVPVPSGRMPAGYGYPTGVSGMRPAGGMEGGHGGPSPQSQPPHTASPPPLSHGSATPPMTFPPPAVPPPYHPHGRSVPGHSYGREGGGPQPPQSSTSTPSGAPPQLTLEQQARARDRERAIQAHRQQQQQQQQLMRQQPPPSQLQPQSGFPQPPPAALAPPSGSLSPRSAAFHGRSSTSPQPPPLNPISPNPAYRGGPAGVPPTGVPGQAPMNPAQAQAQAQFEYNQRKLMMQQHMQQQQQMQRAQANGGVPMDPRVQPPPMQPQQPPPAPSHGQGQHGGGGGYGGPRYTAEQMMHMQRSQQQQQQQQSQYPPPSLQHSASHPGTPLMHPQQPSTPQYTKQQRR